jgi:hypothetical protein
VIAISEVNKMMSDWIRSNFLITTIAYRYQSQRRQRHSLIVKDQVLFLRMTVTARSAVARWNAMDPFVALAL